MAALIPFAARLETKVREQLHGQRVGFLLGAGSSYVKGAGYPLAFELWDLIKDRITDTNLRSQIQERLDEGAQGIEEALDLLDSGSVNEGPHRHVVIEAIEGLFRTKTPSLEDHIEFVKRVSARASPSTKIFNLNYDPMIERAAERARIRLFDGFTGNEHAYFEPSIFEERIGRIRGSYKTRQFEEVHKILHLLKLHGSLGWYECAQQGVRRCSFSTTIPHSTKRLMIPPQKRKAGDTMNPPYSALWSAFRGALVQDAVPLNRLVALGYGFLDEHVNAIIESGLARNDFTLLILTKGLENRAWERWYPKNNVVIATESRCSLKGEIGPGHQWLWQFDSVVKEI